MAQYIESRVPKKGKEKDEKKEGAASLAAPAGQPKGQVAPTRTKRLL